MRKRGERSIEEQVRAGLGDRRNGWWVAAVLGAFAYLEPGFGYRLSGVHMHFRGNFVQYDGPVFDLVVEYDPDDTGTMTAELLVHDDLAGRLHPRALDVNQVLRQRDPDLVLPAGRPEATDRPIVIEALSIWAKGLRELAPDVLRGEWPEGIAGHYLW